MTISFATSPAKKAGVRSPLVGPVALLEMSSYDIVSNSNFTISMLPGEVSVGRILPNDLKSCAWPLLKAMFGGGEGKGPSGFFSLTQDATEATLIMDDRCRAAFDEAAGVAAIEYAPNRWRVLELHLGSLAWEVPGLVCFLATLMAESKVSILNLSSNDRDFMLVQESDVASATRVILERLQHDVVGLKADISHKAMVRRSENTFDDDAFDDGHQGSANGTSAVGGGAEVEASTCSSAAAGPSATAASSPSGPGSEAGAPSSSEGRVFDSERGLFVQVLPTTLVVVRLQFSMLQACAHALIQRMLFAPASGARCFWSYTLSDDEISLILDERSLASFPEAAIVGTTTRWRPLRLSGIFGFDEVGVVAKMFTPYEEGLPLLNISTFSTNVSLVEETDLEHALASFDIPVVRESGLMG